MSNMADRFNNGEIKINIPGIDKRNKENNLETERKGALPEAGLKSDALKYAHNMDEELSNYLNVGEVVTGYGVGGSESLTLFIEGVDKEKIVRKIISERLITPQWDRQGKDVMLAPCSKAMSQVSYLNNLPDDVKPYFPKVIKVVERINPRKNKGCGIEHWEYIYDMSYIKGIEISQLVREYKPCAKNIALLYSVIFKFLNENMHSKRKRLPTCQTLEQSYFRKIEQRLELSHKTAPKTFGDHLYKSEEIVINGVKLRNVSQILKILRGNGLYKDALEPKFHSLVMGDTNTENIKIENIDLVLQDYSNVDFDDIPFSWDDVKGKFLDPRAIGFHEGGVDTEVDDPMYDNKPWHNSLGNYDQIHGEYFDLSYRIYKGRPHFLIAYHEDSPYSKSYNGIEDYFCESMTAAWGLDSKEGKHKQDPFWLIRFVFMMGTHFMAMSPFHFSRNSDGVLIDDSEHQRRPLAIYAEGIKWLNLAVDMLEGKCTEFLGFNVPQIKGGYRDEKYIYSSVGYHPYKKYTVLDRLITESENDI